MTKKYFLPTPQGVVLCTPWGVCTPCWRPLIYRIEIFAAFQGNLCQCYTTLIVKMSFFLYGQTEFPVVQCVSITSCTSAPCLQEEFDLRLLISILQVMGSSQQVTPWLL